MTVYTLIGANGRVKVDDEARTIYLDGRIGGSLDGATATVDNAGGKRPRMILRVDGTGYSVVAEATPPNFYPEQIHQFAAGVNMIARGGKGGPQMVRPLTRRERQSNMTSDEVAADDKERRLKIIVFAVAVIVIFLFLLWVKQTY